MVSGCSFVIQVYDKKTIFVSREAYRKEDVYIVRFSK